MKNPFIAAVLALASQAAAAVLALDLIGAVPSKKRKGKARGFIMSIMSIMSNRHERQLYRSKYVPHQGLREKSRRKDVTTWRACRGTGLNNQQFA